MKPTMTVLALAVASVTTMFVLSADTSAQRGMRWSGSQGWGSGTDYARLYDAKTVETVTGEVVNVQTFTPRKGMGAGLHLQLKTDTETLPVHLGPVWYLENQDVRIEAKDVVDVKGSRVTFEGKPALIAVEVKKGDDTLRLRDQDGYPAWAGWRRR
jgi:hypothetical protein